MAESEVARLRQRIALKYEAASRIFHDFTWSYGKHNALLIFNRAGHCFP